LYRQIHDSEVHEASLATVAGLGGDVIGCRVLRMSRCFGHIDSQSEKAKAGAVNLASTDRPFTNWRSKMHGKTATWLIVD